MGGDLMWQQSGTQAFLFHTLALKAQSLEYAAQRVEFGVTLE